LFRVKTSYVNQVFVDFHILAGIFLRTFPTLLLSSSGFSGANGLAPLVLPTSHVLSCSGSWDTAGAQVLMDPVAGF